MSIFAFCAFLPREFERNRTLSKKTIYRLRKFLGWCIIKLKIRLRIFLYTPVLCLWSSDDRNNDEEFDQGEEMIFFHLHASFPGLSYIIPETGEKRKRKNSDYISLIWISISCLLSMRGIYHEAPGGRRQGRGSEKSCKTLLKNIQ